MRVPIPTIYRDKKALPLITNERTLHFVVVAMYLSSLLVFVVMLWVLKTKDVAVTQITKFTRDPTPFIKDGFTCSSLGQFTGFSGLPATCSVNGTGHGSTDCGPTGFFNTWVGTTANDNMEGNKRQCGADQFPCGEGCDQCGTNVTAGLISFLEMEWSNAFFENQSSCEDWIVQVVAPDIAQTVLRPMASGYVNQLSSRNVVLPPCVPCFFDSGPSPKMAADGNNGVFTMPKATTGINFGGNEEDSTFLLPCNQFLPIATASFRQQKELSLSGLEAPMTAPLVLPSAWNYYTQVTASDGSFPLPEMYTQNSSRAYVCSPTNNPGFRNVIFQNDKWGSVMAGYGGDPFAGQIDGAPPGKTAMNDSFFPYPFEINSMAAETSGIGILRLTTAKLTPRGSILNPAFAPASLGLPNEVRVSRGDELLGFGYTSVVESRDHDLSDPNLWFSNGSQWEEKGGLSPGEMLPPTPKLVQQFTQKIVNSAPSFCAPFASLPPYQCQKFATIKPTWETLVGNALPYANNFFTLFVLVSTTLLYASRSSRSNNSNQNAAPNQGWTNKLEVPLVKVTAEEA